MNYVVNGRLKLSNYDWSLGSDRSIKKKGLYPQKKYAKAIYHTRTFHFLKLPVLKITYYK